MKKKKNNKFDSIVKMVVFTVQLIIILIVIIVNTKKKHYRIILLINLYSLYVGTQHTEFELVLWMANTLNTIKYKLHKLVTNCHEFNNSISLSVVATGVVVR